MRGSGEQGAEYSRRSMADQNLADPVADLLAFLDASPTPYHAVAEAVRRLGLSGYRSFDEREAWRTEAGARGFVQRGGGSLVAFEVGRRAPAEAGFVLIGAHTDSPNLRVKPAPDLTANGCRQLGVEVYGGALLSTWLDRDLGLGGRVALRGQRTVLVRAPGAVCRVPNLAIHLNRDVNTKGLVVNPQTQLVPILGLDREPRGAGLFAELARWLEASGLGTVDPKQILGADLCLFDVQPAALGGDRGELLFSGRLDNLVGCHAALSALLGAGAGADATRVVALFDHEEVGSQSVAGARSKFLESVLSRIAGAATPDELARATARSLLVSVDMAHAVHPNYADRHDKQHRPKLGMGPVIKVNASQSYATDAPAAAALKESFAAAGVEPQYFVSRNDLVCGSTIGPISAARLGVRTVDVGNPMLSMHSCREVCAADDVAPLIRGLGELVRHFRGIDPAQ
jgi:aspartyl aminopeptidase